MRVVIIGQSWLATKTLESLINIGIKPIAALPDKSDRFADTASGLAIPIIADPKNLPECDIAIAAHCHRYIPPEILNRPRHGVVAYHPSLLPRHRGRDAVHWTIAMKDPIAGGSVYVMDDGVDTGEIVLQDWCHVLPNDTPQTLWRRELGPLGVKLLTQSTKILFKTSMLRTTKQDVRATTWEPALSRQKLR
ncbi:formyltransferase family protein [Desulfovibrio sp. UCD-KL4C]|uniref:formyltransferase family protein n=1 Tax=Desulfovibrio sp. UCD-KL4C TaxID=2578120 RepID=UPI0025B834D0|nr:formyltransferase family protein [Desulfovibrio sp. UCD-KL4C]